MTEQSLNRLQRAFLDKAASAHTAAGRGRPATGSTDEAKLWQLAADMVQEEKRRVFGAPAAEDAA
jgi:hypothetical protein